MPVEAVTEIIRFIGEDPEREGLLETPKRVLKAFQEMTSGYRQDPKEILSKSFDVGSDEMVVLKGIRFNSLCEHHLLPFIGTAAVGYLPKKRVVGISKLARLVECYAKRLQIQERMTQQIANALMKHLDALGAGVVIKAHHSCIGCRGVRQPDTEMITSSMLGAMRDNEAARSELLSFL